MKKLSASLLVVVVAAALFWWFRREVPSTGHVEAASTPDLAVATPRATPKPIAATQAVTAQAAPAPAPERTSEMTQAEDAVLSMYDDIIAEMGKDIDNCLAMADAITAAMHKHEHDLEQLKQERADLTPEEFAAAQANLAREQGGRIETQRKTFEQAVARCKRNSQFMEGVRALARAGSPG